MNTQAITFGSLFSGAGGFDLGLERAGWQCKFQVEWDKHCQQVLKYHWADVPKWEDVQTVNGADLPPVDVVAWGSPCQDLSKGSNGAGLAGARSSMFFEGIRIINEMREATHGKSPTVSIWENVAGAVISNDGDDFETVLRQFSESGCHHIEWRVLDSQWFGIAQQRRRIFVLSLYGDTATRAGGEQILAIRTNDETPIAVPESVRRDQSQNDTTHHQSGNNTTTDCSDTTKPSEPLIIDGKRKDDVRVYHNGIAPTLAATMENKTNVPIIVTDSAIRHLTEIELERLMGWEDDHTRFRADRTETPKAQRLKMCGNGVVAPVATWIAERITPLLKANTDD